MATVVKTKDMNKPVKVLNFNADFPQDRDLISKANTYARLPNNRGLPLAGLIRNLLDRALDIELKQAGQSQFPGGQG
jgi:hypothetical protein